MKAPVQPFGNGQVRLRLIEEADLDLTLEWRNRDEARVWFKTSHLITPEQHRAWFRQYLGKDDDFVFVVESQGRPVGQASVYGIDRVAGAAEVGRFLAAPEAQGQGLLTLACAELLRFCGEELKLKSVYLEVKKDNERAIRLYKRSGFCEDRVSDGMIRMSRGL